jgi:hypothetical protein
MTAPGARRRAKEKNISRDCDVPENTKGKISCPQIKHTTADY